MLFNSLAFLAFFGFFVVPFFVSRGQARILVALVASYIFYGWWDWRFTSLLALSTAADFWIARRLNMAERPRARKLLLGASLAVNLGLLGTFKYANFFVNSAVESLNQIGFHVAEKDLGLVLPVGISFYTFQTLSYTIDVYRRKLEPEPNFLRFAAYVAFFPQLVAGPIVRASDFLPQLRADHAFDAERFESGMSLIAWGFVKKVVVADSLSAVVEHRFRVPEAHDSLSLGLGVFCYAFQIYADFSGYSDIAIGTARVLGFEFPENFRQPYFSASFREFWQRWHISLSSWLRDYLYIPLGGNRGGRLLTYRNLMLTMLLGGLWHGANWTFVAWGVLHGSYLIGERWLGPPWERITNALRVPSAARRVLQVLCVFTLTCVAWIFFRAQSIGAGWTILSSLLAFKGFSIAAVQGKFIVAKGLALIAMLVVVDGLLERRKLTRVPRMLRGLAFVACLWSVAFLGSFSGSQFIYFQF